MYLLDTEVVLELRKARTGQAAAPLVQWAASIPRQNQFLSALSLLELQTTAAQMAGRDKSAGERLQRWIADQVMSAFDGHILPIDAAIVRRRAQLNYSDSRNALLAATALEHRLTIVTRNIAAFKAGRVKSLNPWGFSPGETPEDEMDWGKASRAKPVWLRNLFIRS